MAEAKAKKSAPKLFDIAKPGKSAPSSTSRPVIITNRPVLKDPMVIRVNSDGDTDDKASSEPVNDTAEMKHKVDIQPLHIDLSEVLPSGEKAKGDDKKEVEVAEEKVAEPEVTETPEEPEAKTEEGAKEAPSEAVPEASPPPEPKAEEPDEPVAETEPAEETPQEETPAEATPEEEVPLAEPEEAESVIGDDGNPVLSERETKADEEAKKKAEQQEKIIASGEFYLPINAVSKRRAKRNLILCTLLCVVLLAVAAAAAWDAGLLNIPGMQAPTNFL
jgi:hypothetical protein